MLGQNAPRASENFYRNVFALLTFSAFACALVTDSPAAFAAALVFGVLSRSAVKRNWKNPSFTGKAKAIGAKIAGAARARRGTQSP
jgi:hypothetical protein